jgi:hypothetical protein
MNNIQKIIIIAILFLAFKYFVDCYNNNPLEAFTELLDMPPKVVIIPKGRGTVKKQISQEKQIKNSLNKALDKKQNYKMIDSNDNKLLEDDGYTQIDISTTKLTASDIYTKLNDVYKSTLNKVKSKNKQIEKDNNAEKKDDKEADKIKSKISDYGSKISDYDSKFNDYDTKFVTHGKDITDNDTSIETIQNKLNKLRVLRSDYDDEDNVE